MYIREVAMSPTHIDMDDEALETAKRLARAAAYDKYFELAQAWAIEEAEQEHRPDKESVRL